MKKNIKILSIVLVVLIIGFFSYNYVMTAGSRDLGKEKSEFNILAVNIFTEFSANTEIANTKYLNKAVEIYGKVTSVNENVITLDKKVSCQLAVSEKVLIESQLKIKGRVTGYDDLLQELKLDQCIIVK